MRFHNACCSYTRRVNTTYFDACRQCLSACHCNPVRIYMHSDYTQQERKALWLVASHRLLHVTSCICMHACIAQHLSGAPHAVAYMHAPAMVRLIPARQQCLFAYLQYAKVKDRPAALKQAGLQHKRKHHLTFMSVPVPVFSTQKQCIKRAML